MIYILLALGYLGVVALLLTWLIVTAEDDPTEDTDDLKRFRDRVQGKR